MPRFRFDDDDVVVVVGSGAGGGTLANELCQKGQKVVVLEAGRNHAPDDFINDEWRSFKQLAWLDKRTTSGSFRDREGLPQPARLDLQDRRRHDGALGRLLPALHGARVQGLDLLRRPRRGQHARLADRPRRRRALLRPRRGEARLHRAPTASRSCRPTTTTRCSPTAPSASATSASTPAATPAARCPTTGRPASIQDGFNFQGVKNRSKWSTLTVELPQAEATGKLDLRSEAHVIRIEHDEKGLATGVTYIDGDGLEQFQRARLVAVAGNAIETPRLLLNSASSLFPDGLANSSGQVGRNYMRHLTASVYAIFDKPVHFYRGETMAGHIEDEAPNDPARGFVGGYYMQLLALGVPFMAAFMDPGAWGRDFTSALEGYENMAGMWLVGEDMPQESNRVTLNHDELD